MRRRLFPILLVTVLVVAAIAVVALASRHHRQVARGGREHTLSWIINGAALQRIAKLDPALARRYFDHRDTFVTAKAGQQLPEPRATRTQSFASYASLRAALDSGTLDPRTRAVIYDSEHWRFTPSAEQQDPAHYYRLAAQLAHRHHLLLIATPATNLATASGPAGSGGRYARFLRLHVAAAAARYADLYEIQAQGAEANASRFQDFIRDAAAQARAANRRAIVLAGISTNPAGQRVTAATLLKEVQATRRLVGGYWLNDPAGGQYCPACQGPYPQIAVAFLRDLERARL